MVFSLDKLFSNTTLNKYTFILIFGLLYPVFLAIWSYLFNDSSLYDALSGAYPPIILLLVIVISENKLKYGQLLRYTLIALALFTISLVIFDLLGFISVNGPNAIRDAVYKYDMGIMGKSSSYAVYYKVFMKASPLLLLLIVYGFENKIVSIPIISYIALVLSGTRANIFVATLLFLFCLFVFYDKDNTNLKLKIGLPLITLFLLAISISSLIAIVRNMMSAAGSINSDLVRQSQLSSFINLFKHPRHLLFGMGFGSEFFDEGRMEYRSSSEISYLDLLRKIGLIGFIPFLWFILKPFSFNISISKKVMYICYLLICLTNPLLFSSTAYLLYVYLYSIHYDQCEHVLYYSNSRRYEA